MVVVWKQELEVVDEQIVFLPGYVTPLSVEVQKEKLQMWFLCDPSLKPFPHKVKICATGREYDCIEGKYVGTFQMYNGDFVGHVFVSAR